MGRLRAAAVTAEALLTTTSVLAVGDIPTMYTGSFPSTTNLSGITGTFKGKSLVLKGFAGRAMTGHYSCARTSPTQTRCSGTLVADNGTYSDRHIVTITWSAGQPSGMIGTH